MRDERMKRVSKGSIGKSNLNNCVNNYDANKIYRSIVDTSRKLEIRTTESNSISGLFNSETDKLRQKLKEQCETIFFNAPVEFGRRAEELLWRKCYHDVIECYKRWKNKVTSADISLLEINFTVGFGHYNNLILIISKKYSVKLDVIYPYVVPAANLVDYEAAKKLPTEEEVEWANKAVYHMLLYMGDLARYLHDLGQNFWREIAVRFYDAALIWNPDIGMPFNQIGTLNDNNNYGIDSIYYYMRCLNSQKPFEGAESNVYRIFQNNKRSIREFEQQLISTNEESFQVMKRAYCQFINVCQEFWYKKHFQSNDKSLLPLVQEAIYSFKSAFDLKPKMTTVNMPTYLCPMPLFEIQVISLMLFEHLKSKGFDLTNQNNPLGALATFISNFTLFAIQSCHNTFQQKLGSNDEITRPNGLSSFSPRMSKESTPELSPKRTLSRLRRRKAAINYNDGNLLSLDNDDSDLSELEETALSTIDALDIGSDIDSDTDTEDKVENALVSSEDDISPKPTLNQLEDNTEQTVILPAEDLLNFIVFESSLPTIKLFCDWLLVNSNFITFVTTFIRGYLEEFVNFCNTLIKIQEKVLLTFPDLIHLKCTGIDWVQKYPLPSDIKLSNLNLFKSIFKDRVLFTCERELTLIEKGFLYLQSNLSFCHHLTQMNLHSNNINSLSYSVTEKRFKLNVTSNGTQLNLHESIWSEMKSCFDNNDR